MGIDYGNGKTNIDMKTKIRYGVIPYHDVLQAWCDSSEPVYSNCCPICGNEPKSGNDIHNMLRCPSCYKKLDDAAFIDDEAIGYKIDDGEYQASQAIDDCDIFITKSPYYKLCDFCSPCAPGAGYLRNDGDVKAYCFGPDFFEDGIPPYTIYNVSDNSVVFQV